MINQTDLAGCCETIASLAEVDALQRDLIARDPGGDLANGPEFAPMTRGRLSDGRLDTTVKNISEYEPWLGVPGEDTTPGNYVIEFAGGVFLNAAMVKSRYMDPADRAELIAARAKQGTVVA